MTPARIPRSSMLVGALLLHPVNGAAVAPSAASIAAAAAAAAEAAEARVLVAVVVEPEEGPVAVERDGWAALAFV